MSSAWPETAGEGRIPAGHPLPVRVKICGITRVEDALAAVEAGADALGFMFYPPSPRHVTAATAREISRALPPFVARVGVFVDAAPAEVGTVLGEGGMDTLQFHGNETPAYCRGFPAARVIKAFRVSGPETLDRLAEYAAFAWLLDSYVAGSMGGTGRTFNWELAGDAVRRGGRVILAGGLNPDTVARAVAAVRPYGVDVSSGVESAPGRKDPAKLRDFIAAAKGV